MIKHLISKSFGIMSLLSVGLIPACAGESQSAPVAPRADAAADAFAPTDTGPTGDAAAPADGSVRADAGARMCEPGYGPTAPLPTGDVAYTAWAKEGCVAPKSKLCAMPAPRFLTSLL